MKNLLKTSLLVVLSMISSVSFANGDDLALKVKASNEKMITFFMNEGQDVNLTISGQDEEVIFEQKLHASHASAKTYNLSSFPDGNYTLRLETAEQLAEYQVIIKNGKTTLSEPLITATFKPVLTKTDELISLAIENRPDGPIEVSILNEYNDQVYSETFASKAKVPTKFNVGKIDTRELTFIVRSKNQEFIKTVQLR